MDLCTQRLVGKPASLKGFEAVRDALNAPVSDETQQWLETLMPKGLTKNAGNTDADGRFLACALYENGQRKLQDWAVSSGGSKVQRAIEGKLSWRFFYTREATSRFVGAVGAYLSEDTGKIDICYLADPTFAGKGLMSEAVKGFIQGEILRLKVFKEFSFTVHPDNKKSREFAESVIGASTNGDISEVLFGYDSYMKQRVRYTLPWEDFQARWTTPYTITWQTAQ